MKNDVNHVCTCRRFYSSRVKRVGAVAVPFTELLLCLVCGFLVLPGGANPIGHEPKFSLTLRALPSSDWLLPRDFFEVVLFWI